MKNKAASILTLVLVMVLSIGFYPSLVLAQDPAADEPVVEFEGTEFSYGTVKSVSGDQIVISEYDYENDKDIDVTYSVSPEAAFEGVASLSEISAGDSIDIDFEVKGDQKIAVYVAVEKDTGEDLSVSADELTVTPEV